MSGSPWQRPLPPVIGAVLLALLAAAIRLPFGSQMLYSFDSANYALALRDYFNVAHHQPHPPGYPLYVASAKLLTFLVGEPNRSLVALSILAASVTVGLLFLLAHALYGWRIAALSALLLTVMVGFWGYSEVAYPYTSLAMFTTLLALLSYRVLEGRRQLVVPSGVLLGVAAGFRWDVAVYVAPVMGLALARCGWRRAAQALLAAVVVVVSWLLPTVYLTGGWSMYLEAINAQGSYVMRSSSVFAGGTTFLRYNVERFLLFFRQLAGIGLLVLLYSVGRLLTPQRVAGDHRLRFLLLWWAAPFPVFVLIHVNEPGYLLALLPATSLLIALGLGELAGDLMETHALLRARSSTPAMVRLPISLAAPITVPALTVIILVWNVLAFLGGIGPARLPEIRFIDRQLQLQVDFIRREFKPGQVLVLAHDRYRQAQYYLTGYDVRLLFDEYAPDYQRRLTRLSVNGDWKAVVVLDAMTALDPETDRVARRAVLSPGPEISVLVLDLAGADSVEYGYRFIRVVPRAL